METTENKRANSTVLLIDDSSIDNFVNSKIISLYHFAENTIVFSKAKKALNYLEEIILSATIEIPFVIFLDLDMPVVDGFEFLNQFSLFPEKIKKNIKIVILTSSCNHNDKEVCGKHDSVVAFFNKPLIKSDLMVLEQLLLENYQVYS